MQIVIGVDVGRLPSTDAGGPVLTRIEGSCGDRPIEGTAERSGDVRWHDLDPRCAPYQVTLALEGVGARSFFDVRQDLCASVTFGQEVPTSGGGGRGELEPELSVRGGSVVGLEAAEQVAFLGPELIFGRWFEAGELGLDFADRDGPFDVYGLVFQEGSAVYVADDGARRTFDGALPLRVAAAWDAEEPPRHGFALDVGTEDAPLLHRPFRLQMAERPDVGAPRYAEGVVETDARLHRVPAGTAALRATAPGVLEGDLVTFSDGPWGRFEHTSLTAFDDAGRELVTVSLDEGIEDVRVRGIDVPPRFSGSLFSEARVRFETGDWPLTRITISDGPHRWIIVYLDATAPIDLEPRALPIPGGLVFDDFGFMPPVAFVRIEYVEPLRPVDRVSDRLPSPAAVVRYSDDWTYDPDEDW